MIEGDHSHVARSMDSRVQSDCATSRSLEDRWDAESRGPGSAHREEGRRQAEWQDRRPWLWRRATEGAGESDVLISRLTSERGIWCGNRGRSLSPSLLGPTCQPSSPPFASSPQTPVAASAAGLWRDSRLLLRRLASRVTLFACTCSPDPLLLFLIRSLSPSRALALALLCSASRT